MWAGRYGGAGRDGGLAIAAAPNGDLLLVGASAPAPTAATLGLASSPNSSAAAVSSASLFFARLAGGPGLGAVAATSAFPAGAAPPAAARLALGAGSATAVVAYAVAGPAELQLGGQALSVGAAEAGLVGIEARSPPRWSQLTQSLFLTPGHIGLGPAARVRSVVLQPTHCCMTRYSW